MMVLCCNRFQDAILYNVIKINIKGVFEVEHPISIKRDGGKVERIGKGYEIIKECVFCGEPLKRDDEST